MEKTVNRLNVNKYENEIYIDALHSTLRDAKLCYEFW